MEPTNEDIAEALRLSGCIFTTSGVIQGVRDNGKLLVHARTLMKLRMAMEALVLLAEEGEYPASGVAKDALAQIKGESHG